MSSRKSSNAACVNCKGSHTSCRVARDEPEAVVPSLPKPCIFGVAIPKESISVEHMLLLVQNPTMFPDIDGARISQRICRDLVDLQDLDHPRHAIVTKIRSIIKESPHALENFSSVMDKIIAFMDDVVTVRGSLGSQFTEDDVLMFVGEMGAAVHQACDKARSAAQTLHDIWFPLAQFLEQSSFPDAKGESGPVLSQRGFTNGNARKDTPEELQESLRHVVDGLGSMSTSAFDIVAWLSNIDAILSKTTSVNPALGQSEQFDTLNEHWKDFRTKCAACRDNNKKLLNFYFYASRSASSLYSVPVLWKWMQYFSEVLHWIYTRCTILWRG